MSHDNATQWSPWLTVERPSPVIPGPWTLAVNVLVPVKLESCNAASHGSRNWQSGAWATAKIRKVVGAALVGLTPPALPCVVRCTRISTSRQTLDADNLFGQRGMKAVFDTVALFLDVADDNPGLRFVVRQERGPTWAARIEVFARGAVQP